MMILKILDQHTRDNIQRKFTILLQANRQYLGCLKLNNQFFDLNYKSKESLLALKMLFFDAKENIRFLYVEEPEYVVLHQKKLSVKEGLNYLKEFSNNSTKMIHSASSPSLTTAGRYLILDKRGMKLTKFERQVLEFIDRTKGSVNGYDQLLIDQLEIEKAFKGLIKKNLIEVAGKLPFND